MGKEQCFMLCDIDKITLHLIGVPYKLNLKWSFNVQIK